MRSALRFSPSLYAVHFTPFALRSSLVNNPIRIVITSAARDLLFNAAEYSAPPVIPDIRSETRRSDIGLMYVAPLPVARLESLHDGMAGLLKVFIGVLAGRRIAAAYMSADRAHAQLHPRLAFPQTFGTTIITGGNAGISLLNVLARGHNSASGNK
jgi:hypothetical protein